MIIWIMNFTPEQFLAGMDMQDDRYRYNYFNVDLHMRTEEITPFHREEIREFMEREWCGEKLVRSATVAVKFGDRQSGSFLIKSD